MLTGVDRATGTQLDDVNIRYQINTFLIAGHETTSGLLSLHALRAAEESGRAAEGLRRGRPRLRSRSDHQADLPAGDAASLHQPGAEGEPAVVAAGAGLLGLSAERGSRVRLQAAQGDHHQHSRRRIASRPRGLGPRADIFDPENFSPEAERNRPAWAWKPFGNGQRACIGRGFAMHEAALALGMILQRFKLVDHKRYQMQLKETLTIKPDGLRSR